MVISASGVAEALLEKFEAVAGAAVHHGVAHGRHEPAEHGGIDSHPHLDRPAGHPAQGVGELLAPIVVELDGDPDLGQAPVALRGHPVDEVGQQLLVVAGPAHLGGVGGQADGGRGGPALQQIDDQRPRGSRRERRGSDRAPTAPRSRRRCA